MATKQITRSELHQQNLVSELLNNNLRRGASSTRSSVQALICLLTRNNPTATEKLNNLIYTRLAGALAGGEQLLTPIHEVTLLAALVKQKDSCWESRLKTVIRLFIAAAKKRNSPAIMDAFTLPCLNILQDVMKSGSAPPAAPRKKKTRKSQTALTVNKLNLCLFVRQLMFGHG